MSSVVLLSALEDDPFREQPRMRFRLTYDGELKAVQRDPAANQADRLAEHKQSIRKVFHRQLKRLWQTNRFLKEHRMYGNETPLTPGEQSQAPGFFGGGPDDRIPMVQAVANNYRENGYRFVPLVREELSLLCSLDILFLRQDHGAGAISAGDLDNRIKTLIDALRRPLGANELRGNETPAPDEDPFFCLLEDDRLVTELKVRTDDLLDVPTADSELSRRMVKLFITVEIKPHDVTMLNLSFA